MKPRVFVIMSFGTKTLDVGADAARPGVAVDFDRVFTTLLKPAIERAGCEAFRADAEQSEGDIRTDMFFELVTADFVLADVSVFNPNVFYELGVRHGMTPRGTILVSGGWNRAPFDIAPDRRFFYEGPLFEVGKDEPKPGALEDEVRRLAKTLEHIIASDAEKTASPVFAALPGLKAGDWSTIENARARYFNVVIDATMRRVETARAEGLPGDIMTLAEKAPTRFHEERLLLEAARGLMDLQRFALAREKLEELLRLDPESLPAKLRLALVLNRLDRGHEAELMLREISAQAPKDMDVLNTLGRVYKDLWRRQWEDRPDVEQRRSAALRGYALAARAANYFSAAFSGNLNAHQSGINALGMIALCEQLQLTGGEELTVVRQVNTGIAEAVELAARAVLSRGSAGGMRPADEVWAYATRGEGAILRGDGSRARHEYRKATGLTDCTMFMIETMLSQLKLYDLLGVHQDIMAPVLADLEYQLEQRKVKLKRYEQVVVFSGHRTDDPGQTPVRFPESQADAVAAKIRDRLHAWGIGPHKPVLAICGAARGGDILFAEQCRQLGADLRLLVPLPEGEFLDRRVRGDVGHWEDRYFDLKRDRRCRVFFEPEQLGRPADDAKPYDRNNRWLLNSARAEVDPDDLYVLTLYDSTGPADPADGTREFVEQARRYASHYENINPRDLLT